MPICSYEQHQLMKDPTKQGAPQNFTGTMEFVKQYLEDVASQSLSVADREQNQLTFQVKRPSEFLCVFLKVFYRCILSS